MKKITLAALILALGLPLYAQTLPTTLVTEVGYVSATQIDWYGSQPLLLEGPAAIRVRDTMGGSLAGAWTLMLTRVELVEADASLPAWLQPGGDTDNAAELLTTTVLSKLTTAAQTKMASAPVAADSSLFTVATDYAFGGSGHYAELAQYAASGSSIEWHALPLYWSYGIGAQYWARTFQEERFGSDTLDLVRTAEMAMLFQAPSGAAVDAFLQSTDYQALLENHGLLLTLQPVVFRKSDPFTGNPPLPLGPEPGDDDFDMEIPVPIALELPISKPDSKGTHSVPSTPGVVFEGTSAGDTVFFFTGRAMPVAEAIFPVISGGTTTWIAVTLDDAIPSLPGIGVQSCKLPAARADLDPNYPIEIDPGVTIPAYCVMLGDIDHALAP